MKTIKQGTVSLRVTREQAAALARLIRHLDGRRQEAQEGFHVEIEAFCEDDLDRILPLLEKLEARRRD